MQSAFIEAVDQVQINKNTVVDYLRVELKRKPQKAKVCSCFVKFRFRENFCFRNCFRNCCILEAFRKNKQFSLISILLLGRISLFTESRLQNREQVLQASKSAIFGFCKKICVWGFVANFFAKRVCKVLVFTKSFLSYKKFNILIYLQESVTKMTFYVKTLCN
jgi:hypothetical protein